VSFFVFLLLVGLISHKRNVNYLNYSLSVPQNCKANTDANVICQDYQIYWHYTDKKSQAALVKQFTSVVLHNSNSILADTIQFDPNNHELSTLVFKADSKITATISFGELQERSVIIVFEPRKPLQSIELFPTFVKNLLSLS
jgi:hypothetical protein